MGPAIAVVNRAISTPMVNSSPLMTPNACPTLSNTSSGSPAAPAHTRAFPARPTPPWSQTPPETPKAHLEGETSGHGCVVRGRGHPDLDGPDGPVGTLQHTVAGEPGSGQPHPGSFSPGHSLLQLLALLTVAALALFALLLLVGGLTRLVRAIAGALTAKGPRPQGGGVPLQP